MVTASEAREPDVFRDCSNRLLGGAPAKYRIRPALSQGTCLPFAGILANLGEKLVALPL